MDRESKIAISIVAGIFAVALSLGFIFSSLSCSAKAVSFEDRSWGIVQGCMVKHNGRWLPLENIRGFDDKG